MGCLISEHLDLQRIKIYNILRPLYYKFDYNILQIDIAMVNTTSLLVTSYFVV